jgi:hypothetical protein
MFFRSKICAVHESLHGPSVWTGRALQAENDDLEKPEHAQVHQGDG